MAKFGESILLACASLASRRPWLVVGIALLVTAAAAYASLGLTINTSTEEVLSSELPFRQADKAYRAAFPRKDQAIVVIDAASSDEAEQAAQALVERLRTRQAVISGADLAGASPYFDRYGLLFVGVDRLATLGGELRQARRLLVNLSRDPTLRGMAGLLRVAAAGIAESSPAPELANLLDDITATTDGRAEGRPAEIDWRGAFDAGADRGTRRLVEIMPILDNTSIDRAGPALDALDADMKAVLEGRPGVTMHVTGDPVLRQQELNDAFSGAAYASGFSFVLVTLSLVLGIRSGRLIAALIIALIVGSIWTTGLAAVTVGGLNLISVTFLVLFFGLGVDFGTHLGLRHLEEARAGHPFAEALRRAMVGEGASIGLSALCAALAFLAFVPTAYTGLAEFGIISALGMLVAVVVTFTLQPALMALMPPKPKPGTGIAFHIGAWIRRRYRAILVAAGLATVAAAVFAVGARLDVNPLNLQDPEAEPVVTYRNLALDPETSPYALNVLAPDLDAAAALAEKLGALPGVGGVRWIGNFVPEDQPARLRAIAAIRDRMGEAFFGEVEAEPAPTDAELAQAFADLRATARTLAGVPGDAPLNAAAGRMAAALDRFAERRGAEPAALGNLGTALAGGMPALVADLKAKLSVARPVGVDDIPAELRDDWIAKDGQVRLRVLPKGDIGAQDALEDFAAEVQAVAPGAAGVPATVTGAGAAILSAFVEAIAYTVIAISLVIILLRRRFSDVLLVLAPLAVASLWTVAASAILGMPFNFANIIVIPLLIGLGVASSIHIVIRSHEVMHDSAGAHEEGTDVLDTSTPLAVLVAQLNTVAAFATLALSHHRGLYSMGLLLGLAILFVLIVSLVVLPAFMIAFETRRGAPGAAAGPSRPTAA